MPQNLVPPQNLDAEKTVIGAVLLDYQLWDQVSSSLVERDFYLKAHQLIFRAMKELADKGRPIDLLTVADLLSQHSELGPVGGAEYLAELASCGVSSINLDVYVQLIKEKSLLRLAIQEAQQIMEEAYKQEFESIDYFIDKAEERFFKLSENRQSSGLTPAIDIVQAAMKRIEALSQLDSEVTGIASGLESLDKMTSGFQPGELIIIAARPSMGKTAFSLNIAEHMVIRLQKTVAYFALEMSKESLMNRLIAMNAGVSMKQIRSGKLNSTSWPKLIQAAARFGEAKIFINDTSNISPIEIRTQARRLKSQVGLDCIIIDYLQLMKLKEKAESREREVAEISRSLKAIAKELQIPVIALAQLNRGVEGRTEKRPMLSDLRESGSIEQDADLIMMLYREDYYDKEDSEKQGKAEVIIAKQRNGPTGTVKLHFESEIGRFREMPTPQPTAQVGFATNPTPALGEKPKAKSLGPIVNLAPEA
jgi:replicative DNA helicase